MADPRFYDNRGPFTLAELCAKIAAAPDAGADASALVHDLASLEGAGPGQLAFCDGSRASFRTLAASSPGFCLIAGGTRPADAPAAAIMLHTADAVSAFAAAGRLFYPQSEAMVWPQQTPVDPTAVLASEVLLGPGVVIGPGAEIGARTRIGANAVIGPGVAIGRDCEIASNVTIMNSYIGDHVVIQPGARIGQGGYGFASGPQGHAKIPQLGRVIVQDHVEIGANSAIDRGALGDTTIGEGTKIDNLVHIGHNGRLGRHCLITGQVGFGGSAELGDFVIVGGQTAIGDHTKIGDGARFAARSGVQPGEYPGGMDYGGYPVRPMKDYRREVAALALLAKRGKRDKNE